MPFPVRDESKDPWPHQPTGAWITNAINVVKKDTPRKDEKADLARRGLIRTQNSRI